MHTREALYSAMCVLASFNMSEREKRQKQHKVINEANIQTKKVNCE